MADDIDVLVVEDDTAYATMIRLVFGQEASDLQVRTAQTGAEAMEILSTTTSSNGHRPVLLLDLELPDIHGTQVLAQVREDPALRDVPVAVLTGSEAIADMDRCLELEVEAYVVKPDDLDEFIQTIRGIGRLLDLA